ncbi:MAG: hypothetical protein FWE91_01555 [Defluviitaleaceae bacterium]|nr:hypothetical protein [Defluviitaleaceae bacterium]MCL2835725.1 hypothetical protein [Defluviitaleaceae bacterium]
MALFTSKEERLRKEKEYVRKIFPLGIEQRELALAALRPHISPRINDAEILYAFIVAKQKYLDADNDIRDAEAYMKKTGGFTGDEKRRILTLIKLDAGAENLSDYPGAESII